VSVHGLLTGHRPDPSGLGIVVAALSVVVMPLLGHAKYCLGARLGSAATAGEGPQSLLCAALAGAVLISLLSTPHWAGGGWIHAPVSSPRPPSGEGRGVWRG
jgi:divalent metal cation (Fe/Co/Zn/Cd) transporter